VRRIYQMASLILLGVGLFLVYQGRSIGLAGHFGPGPGFFAFWVGIGLAVLSSVWCGRVSLRPVKAVPPGFIPDRDGMVRVACVLFAMVVFVALLEPIGFNMAMFGLLFFLFFAFGRDYPILKIAISIAGSFGVHYVFERLLRVPLPYSSIAFLRSLGF
jgi:putative tricarboxylic transport membrane protein